MFFLVDLLLSMLYNHTVHRIKRSIHNAEKIMLSQGKVKPSRRLRNVPRRSGRKVPIAVRGFHGPVDLRLYYPKKREEYEFTNSTKK